MKIRIAGTVSESIVDGPGFRYTVFVQGCPHNCAECHNPQTHDPSGGKLIDTDELFKECIEDPLNKGVTFSGGEPFLQAAALYELGRRFKERGLSLWCYSGWTFEELQKRGGDVQDLLSMIDVLVDGRFIAERRTLSLPFRGSDNQRLVDVQASIENGAVVEYAL